jgi:hypothetical protein
MLIVAQLYQIYAQSIAVLADSASEVESKTRAELPVPAEESEAAGAGSDEEALTNFNPFKRLRPDEDGTELVDEDVVSM